MEDDKFKLSKSNYINIGILIACIIFLIISSLLLISSLKNEKSELPYLNITKGRTSTSEIRTTTDQTTTTTTTTAFVEMFSPYYNVDVNSLYTEDLFTKANVNKTEAKEIITMAMKYANQIINPSDNSLLDISTTISHAHAGEIDMKEMDGHKYGIVYNGHELFNKLFYSLYTKTLNNKYINNVKVFDIGKENIYRVENTLGDLSIEINNVELDVLTTSEIYGIITYYKSNYKEEGHSSPVYKKVTLKLIYSDGRWKVFEYKYPLFD